MLTDITEITLVTEATLGAKHWAPNTNGDGRQNAPMLLISDEEDISQWSAFADAVSESGNVYAVWEVSPYTLVQTIWIIGEPCSLIAHGKEAGDKALRAAQMAKGAIRALALVDYGSDGDDVPQIGATTCPVVLIRGRQSEIADHHQIVTARAAIGSKCKLVELENCGSRAAESCPQDFLATIQWFLDEAVAD